LLLLKYFALGIACAVFYTEYNQNFLGHKIEQEKGLKIERLLIPIYNQKQNCWFCIFNISTSKTVRDLVIIQQQKQGLIIERIKPTFNGLFLLHSFIIYLVFTAPKSINIITLINSIVVVFLIFIDSVNIYLESFVAIVFLVIISDQMAQKWGFWKMLISPERNNVEISAMRRSIENNIFYRMVVLYFKLHRQESKSTSNQIFSKFLSMWFSRTTHAN
jgi:hypothetical protein